jgi:hypothetical protein
MKKQSFAIVTSAAVMGLCLAASMTAVKWLEMALDRYPGAVEVESENWDTSRLSRGWLTRQASYQSPDDRQALLGWYAFHMPQADMREAGDCVTLRRAQTFIWLSNSNSVLLCQLPHGTRIMVKQEIHLAPAGL